MLKFKTYSELFFRAKIHSGKNCYGPAQWAGIYSCYDNWVMGVRVNSLLWRGYIFSSIIGLPNMMVKKLYIFYVNPKNRCTIHP